MHKWPLRSMVVIVFLVFIGKAVANVISFDRTLLIINGETYSLEIAKTSKQRQQGLMYRHRLEMHKGMLFVYPQPGNHRIWMKNTLMPLSVIWLDENEVVIDLQILQPCDADPCQSYGVSTASKYIIELNSQVRNISPGDSIKGLKQFE